MVDVKKPVKVTVNGRQIETYEGLTILQTLIQAEIHIPHLCHDIRLEHTNGGGGLCVVEPNESEVVQEVKACQTQIKEGMVITTNSPTLKSYRKIRLEQILSDHNADCLAPCVMTCPANVDIQSYLRHVGNGNFQTALSVIKDSNPFPMVCGRVCPHPCEAQCRRNLVDSPVAINHVKRFIADWDMAQEKPWLPKCKPRTGKKIAVIGAGPSGLSAAYYSAINGHDVSVFERQPKAGGMMRYGIPEYRLPKADLDKEVASIQQLGVKIMTNKTLGRDISLEDLHNDFDAVYLAIGSWRATPLQIEGENLDGVWLGIDFLEQVTKNAEITLGDTVVVIGGGNTAIDCARTALRKGAKTVKLLYRRTREEMPAEPYEVEEAIREGVEPIFLISPSKIEPKGAKKELHCVNMQLGEPDHSGRRRPVLIEGSSTIIETDTIIGAIGQSTYTQFLYHDLPIALNKWGDIQINGNTSQTSEMNVFAGGDCVTDPATVIQAVAAGHRASDAMDSFLMKGYIKDSTTDYSCSRGSLEDLPKSEFEDLPKLSRTTMPSLEVSQRENSFDEVELGYTKEMAIQEAQRCLKCGCDERFKCELRKEASAYGIAYRKPFHDRPYTPPIIDHPIIIRDNNKCISCGLCIAACAEIEGPDVLAFRLNQGRQTAGTKGGQPLSETDCVSCGQCVNICPCGALTINSEKSRVFRAINNPDMTVAVFVAPAVRSVISSEFKIPCDETSPFMAGMLKQLGFDKVFDLSVAADLTIVEETTEFLTRMKSGGAMPQFTSCCPGWVNFVEKRYPEIIPHLSSCKSPQMMMGATIKNHYTKLTNTDKKNLYVVSVAPCIAKKHEASRPEFSASGIRDVDAVITTNEILEVIKLKRINTSEIVPQEFDEPYRHVSGAGVLFGNSGGVAEAAVHISEPVNIKEIKTPNLFQTHILPSICAFYVE